MDAENELRIVEALESIVANLKIFVEIIDKEQLYVRGDIHTMTGSM